MTNYFKFTKPLRVGVAVIVISALMKILHLQGANIVLILGCALVVILQLLHFARLEKKRLKDALISSIITSFVTFFMLKAMNWPYSYIPLGITAVSLLIFTIHTLFQSGKELTNEGKEGKYLTFIYALGFLMVILGSWFKIIQWPGGYLMLLIGLGLFAFFIIYDLFKG